MKLWRRNRGVSTWRGPSEGYGESFHPINIYYGSRVAPIQLFRALIRYNPNFLLDRTWTIEEGATIEGNRNVETANERINGLTLAKRIGSINSSEYGTIHGYDGDNIHDITIDIDWTILRIDCVPGSEIDRCVADYLEKVEGFDFVW